MGLFVVAALSFGLVMFKLSGTMEHILSRVYYDQSSPASYGGREAVNKTAKVLYPKVT